MKRVWFNQWFSTSYRLIELMKYDDDKKIVVIGSNQQINSVIRNVCDEWYREPALSGEAYVRFCLEFCKIHCVDIFVPGRHMQIISKYKDKFQSIGVKIMVDDYDKLVILNNIAKTYQCFKPCNEIHIPEYTVVNTAEQFISAYRKLRERYERLCVEIINNEGEVSSYKVTEETKRIQRLCMRGGTDLGYNALLETLKEVPKFDDMILRPHLDGHDITVDCLQTYRGLIAIPRERGAARHEKVIFDAEILKMTDIIAQNIGLKCPFNIHFRYMNGVPYLLKINTRMSGGLQMSCLATDLNIPNIALNQLLDIHKAWTMERKSKIVSYIEVPQIISQC